jgi:DNA-directed RNA polymerase sigma subunit (sigma70/sigma32)
MSPQNSKPSDDRRPTASDRRTQSDDAAMRALKDKLSGILNRLPDIERQVLEHRMGLVDGTPAKPGETATRLGLTITEVKRIEERAFSRIRDVMPTKGLERFLSK